MTTCENYGVYTHQQIRHEMCDGAGPSSQAEAMVGWHELAGRLTTIRHYLDSAIGGVLASRQGVAADAAVGSMVPLGAWLDEVQRRANDTRDRIDHQIAGFTKARDSIPEVPAEPRGTDWQEYAVIDLFTTSDQEADEAVIAEQQRQARAAMMLYQDTTNERMGSIVRFSPPPAGTPDLIITSGRHAGVDALPGDVGGAAGGVEPGVPTPPAGMQGGNPGDPSGTPPAVTGAQGGSALAGAEHSGVRLFPAVLTPPAGDGPGGNGSHPADTGPHGSGRVPAGRIGPGSSGGVHGRPASDGFGPLGGRGRGTGGNGPARGAGLSGASDQPPVRGRGASRSGDPGTPGAVAPSAGTNGHGSEGDERRQPSYLLEPDSNRLVGILPPTAPAVIGEDLPNDDKPCGP